jgi:hypothetical protein
MKIAILMFLLACAASAWAQEDQTNIYDEFRKSWKHPTDEQIMAIIKRHMANLLYPVDLASFAGPDKDAKFRSQIVELQKEMGVPMTGVLTSAQFYRLAQAAANIDSPYFSVGTKLVTRADDGKWVSAVGTGAGDVPLFVASVGRVYNHDVGATPCHGYR